jgi:hypothetical protein
LGGEALAAFGHDEAERLDQVWVRVEDPLHRGVADFQDFGFFEGNDVRSPWLACEEGHLTKEVAFVQGGDIPRPPVFADLDADFSIVNDKHRRTRIAGPNHHFARRKHVSDGGLGQHRGFVCG